jgi:hypothetical protein
MRRQRPALGAGYWTMYAHVLATELAHWLLGFIARERMFRLISCNLWLQRLSAADQNG